MTPPRHPDQPDLLDWQPPEPVASFAPERVRAANLGDGIARAVAAALRDADVGRDEIAARMSAFLGEPVPRSMLDAYASEARRTHPIPVTRLIALIHATRDRRLLQLIAEPMGWAVIERRHLPLIELAAVQDRAEELRRRADALRRAARNGGAL